MKVKARPDDALAKGMETYNARLLDVCARHHLECVDLARVVPKDLTMFYDDAHFTEQGAERLAQAVANHLKSRQPFAGRGGRVGPPSSPLRSDSIGARINVRGRA